MQSTVIEKRDHLIKLLKDYLSGQVAQNMPTFSPDLIQDIERFSPEALLIILHPTTPREFRAAASDLLVAILLDTSYIVRFSYLLALQTCSRAHYAEPLLKSLQEDTQPDAVKQLGRIAAKALLTPPCETRSCFLHKAYVMNNLLKNLTAYHEN